MSHLGHISACELAHHNVEVLRESWANVSLTDFVSEPIFEITICDSDHALF